MVMEGLGLGADLNETASENPSSWGHLGHKGQLANEGEQLLLCAPLRVEKMWSSLRREVNLSGGSVRTCLALSICTSRNIRTVEGSVRFSFLVATPNLSQRASMPKKIERQMLVRDGPAIKK